MRKALIAAAALVAGCGGTVALRPPTTPSSVPVGPGPQATYTVQQQPAAGACHYRYTKTREPLPDHACTPGATNPRVMQTTISATICVRGYTATIRPPASVTRAEKQGNARSYGYAGSMAQAEYDHLIPLELGGDPNDPRNLWVEPPSPGHQLSQLFRNPKDAVENAARARVCAGLITLDAAQRQMASDWTAVKP